jgi:hypothetical protein
MLSPAFLIPLAVSALLGAAGGSAFIWSAGQRAWEILTAAFLWTLISAAGTIIGRYAGERLRRGEWRRGLRIAATQSLPLAAAFLLCAAAAGAPIGPSVIPLAFGAALVVGGTTGALGVLTSPYIR